MHSGSHLFLEHSNHMLCNLRAREVVFMGEALLCITFIPSHPLMPQANVTKYVGVIKFKQIYFEIGALHCYFELLRICEHLWIFGEIG